MGLEIDVERFQKCCLPMDGTKSRQWEMEIFVRNRCLRFSGPKASPNAGAQEPTDRPVKQERGQESGNARGRGGPNRMAREYLSADVISGGKVPRGQNKSESKTNLTYQHRRYLMQRVQKIFSAMRLIFFFSLCSR